MSSARISVDLHGLSRYQAKIKLDSALRKADGSVYELLVIHGYHNGSALKEMILAEYAAHPRVLRIRKTGNEGETVLVLREIL